MLSGLDIAIIYCLSDGHKRTEVAELLEIPQNEVTYRMQLMFSELQVKTSAHLVATALRKGWIK